MKWISAQPATIYYAWQVDVYLNNFIQNGVLPSDIHVLFGLNGDLPKEIRILIEKYKDVNFFLYNDLRFDKSYIPSIYFNLCKQHWEAHKELENEVVMMHDSDTLLTKPFPTKGELFNSNVWWFSDTKSYINYDYIMQKGEDVYQRMLDIVGIDGTIPKLLNSNSGGAQHLMKGVPYAFWNKVEKDSIQLYRMFCEWEPKWTRSDYPIQKWTAGMWSLLWNSWYFGFETKISDKLDFCWSTDMIDMMEGKQFLHNAGVTADRQDLFFKGNYTHSLPYGLNLPISPLFCSSEYYRWVQKVENDWNITNL